MHQRPARLTALLTAALILSGCAAAGPTEPDNCEPRPNGPLDPARKVLVAGRFQASNYRGSGPVTVSATGTHPSTSWKTALEVVTAADGSQEATLFGEPPAGTAGQAITRFYVTAELKPTTATSIRVHDADGTHDVPIRFAHPE